jgi:hypothetical protein
MKWSEDQLNAVKGKELRPVGFESVHKGIEEQRSVGLGEMCEIESCIVRFTHCLVYLVVFNTDSS